MNVCDFTQKSSCQSRKEKRLLLEDKNEKLAFCINTNLFFGCQMPSTKYNV